MIKAATDSDLQSAVAEIIGGLQNIETAILAVARRLVEFCDRYQGFIDILAEQSPGVSKTFLRRLERVGRGVLDPRVALGIEHGMLVERLTVEDQRKIIDVGVQVAVGDRGEDTQVLKLEDMDQSIVTQVLRNGSITSLQHQRSEIMQREQAAKRVHLQEIGRKGAAASSIAKLRANCPFKVDKKRGCIVFSRPPTLTLAQLQLLIMELEK